MTNVLDASTTPNVLFRNDGDGTSSDITSTLEGGGAFDGRGVAFADGDVDVDVDGDERLRHHYTSLAQ